MKRHSKSSCDVLIAGGGTAGVVAAIAAARMGVKTTLIEMKGYTGGTVVEGGTALHSFYNLWKAFPGVPRKQLVKGIPAEIVDRLIVIGGCPGHLEVEKGYHYDSVCTAIDTELYKILTMQMLKEANVRLCLNSMIIDAKRIGDRIRSVTIGGHQGLETIIAKVFVDCTGYGDLSTFAGAEVLEMNDYPVANSIGMANVSVEGYFEFLKKYDAITELCYGRRDGKEYQIIRLHGNLAKLPEEFRQIASEIGMHTVITTTHDNYFMFLKLNWKMEGYPTDRDAMAQAEIELRNRQLKAVELFRRFVPGCEKAFIARTSPSACIRRARIVRCDYDLTLEDILNARRFDDEIMLYGFHDCAPRLKIKDGGAYGIPYRALLPVSIDNLLVAGMMITSDWEAHMSTRNTVACMGQGQAVGVAAAICAKEGIGTREVSISHLQRILRKQGVILD